MSNYNEDEVRSGDDEVDANDVAAGHRLLTDSLTDLVSLDTSLIVETKDDVKDGESLVEEPAPLTSYFSSSPPDSTGKHFFDSLVTNPTLLPTSAAVEGVYLLPANTQTPLHPASTQTPVQPASTQAPLQPASTHPLSEPSPHSHYTHLLSDHTPQVPGPPPPVPDETPQVPGLTPQVQGPPPQVQGPPPQVQGPPPQVQGPPPQVQGPIPQVQGPPPQVPGLTPQVPGPIPQVPWSQPHTHELTSDPTNHYPQAQGPLTGPLIYDPTVPVPSYPTQFTPEVTPYLPETTPNLPQTPFNTEITSYLSETPFISETTPYLPETTPYLPETTSYLPETTPYLPETTPYLPETTPYLSSPIPDNLPKLEGLSIHDSQQYSHNLSDANTVFPHHAIPDTAHHTIPYTPQHSIPDTPHHTISDTPLHTIPDTRSHTVPSPEAVIDIGDVYEESDMIKDRLRGAWSPQPSTLTYIRWAREGREMGLPPPTNITLTNPRILIEESLGDPIRQLLEQQVGRSDVTDSRPISGWSSQVTQDITGLKQLIKMGHLRSGVDLTTRLLTSAGQGSAISNEVNTNTPYTLQLWFVRLWLLMKLELYDAAASEAEQFGIVDTPDLYYGYPNMDRGLVSMVPFSFRLLLACIPHRVGQSVVTLDKLNKIKLGCSLILNNIRNNVDESGEQMVPFLRDEDREASQMLWSDRHLTTQMHVGNTLVDMGEIKKAEQVYKQVLLENAQSKASNQRRTAHIWSALATLHLQVGDVESCEECLVESDKCIDMECADDPLDKFNSLLNRGNLLLSKGHYDQAYSYLKQALNLQPTDPTVINNVAVCLVYQCKLGEALTTICQLLPRTNDGNNEKVSPDVLFNICTMYELESSRAHMKKVELLTSLAKTQGDGFNTFCLKMG